MPDEMLQRIVRQYLSLLIPQSSEGLLLMLHRVCKLRRVCKCWKREVHESQFESVFEVQKCGTLKQIKKWGALKTIPTLKNVVHWMVLATLSAACSTGATLTSVRMTIYWMAYHMYENSMYIRPPRICEVLQWPLMVSETISRVLEQSHVRLTREQILKILMRKNISPIYQSMRQRHEKACARLIKLQAVYRGFSQAKKYKQARAHLVRLQAVYRGFSQQHKYKQARARLISLTATI